jgi:hypothetical protein
MDALPPEERATCTHWIRDWVGPTSGLDAVTKTKILSGFELRQFSPHPVAIATELS